MSEHSPICSLSLYHSLHIQYKRQKKVRNALLILFSFNNYFRHNMFISIFFMFKNFKKFIYSNFKIFLIRFTENKNYIQGMFYTNNRKIGETHSTTLESQSSESIKTILGDDFENQNLDNTSENILVKKMQLTSEQ